MGLYNSVQKTIKAFSHCGWVNGLTTDQYNALDELLEFEQQMKIKKREADANKKLAKSLRKDGLTIREICKAMGYAHPGSVSHLLK